MDAPVIKFVLVGDEKVGKTAIILRYYILILQMHFSYAADEIPKYYE